MEEKLFSLEEQIRVVAEARQEAQILSDKRKSMYDEFISLHTDFFAEVATAGSKASEAEDKLRELTIKAYQETGNKAPALGVGIREVTKLGYDPKEAFRWALEHKLALQLDTKKFATLAKDGTIEFVTITTEPQATIATDLNQFIEDV